MVSITGTKNFTKRKKLFSIGDKPDIIVKVNSSGLNNSIFSAEININNDKNRNFPDDANITLVVNSKRGFLSEPFNCGTISNQKSLIDVVLNQVSPETLNFNLRVGKGDYLLGLGENIIPPDPDKDDSVFLGVQEDDFEQIYNVEIECNSAPILVVKRGLDLKISLKNDTIYQGLIYPAALRIILLRYLFQKKEFDGCKYKKAYILKFSELNQYTENIEEENDERKIIEWIDCSITNFCNIENKSKRSILELLTLNINKTKDEDSDE